MLLTISQAALANAGPTATICEGSVYPLSGASASGYASLAWSTSGSGSFDNLTLLHPVYTPSVVDINAGVVTLTLTANALAMCTNAVSVMTLNITRQVTVNAGPDATICQTFNIHAR